MSNATMAPADPVGQIMQAYREKPSDWLRVTDIAIRTGMPASVIQETLDSNPKKFKHESVFGGHVYGIRPPSVSFRFLSDSTDAERVQTKNSLTERYGATVGTSGGNPYLRVQPDGLYAVVLMHGEDPAVVAEGLRAMRSIDPESVRVDDES